MCGFIASFGLDVDQNNFKNALKHLSRRGPDSEGIWAENKVFLGSRRLAIFDLNNRSDQPMHSSCSRYIIIFNGSIYMKHNKINKISDSLSSVLFKLFIFLLYHAVFSSKVEDKVYLIL